MGPLRFRRLGPHEVNQVMEMEFEPILLTPKFLLFNDFLVPKMCPVMYKTVLLAGEPLCGLLSDCF